MARTDDRLVGRTSSHQQPEMTTGALIFAYRNEAFDYVRMAAWAAAHVRRHLDIPVAIVTDQPTDLDFDRVILHASAARDTRWFSDAGQSVAWNNHGRPDAFDLTPWDRTLLLDADYVVASDRLLPFLDSKFPSTVCHDRAYDVTGMNDFKALNRLGQYDWPLSWATVLIFDRSRHAELLFRSMQMIRDNWQHYRQIYQDRSRTYRNDHALTIALNMINGHTTAPCHIPWSLATVMPEHSLKHTDLDRYRVDFQRADNKPAWLEIAGQDFHAMGKQSLMDLMP